MLDIHCKKNEKFSNKGKKSNCHAPNFRFI